MERSRPSSRIFIPPSVFPFVCLSVCTASSTQLDLSSFSVVSDLWPFLFWVFIHSVFVPLYSCLSTSTAFPYP